MFRLSLRASSCLKLSQGVGFSSQERGSALTEFAMTIPFLLILSAGLVDLGRGLNEYLRLSQVARASVRHAAVVPNVQEGSSHAYYGVSCNNGENDNPLERLGQQTVLSGHERIQERVEDVLKRQPNLLSSKRVRVDSTLMLNNVSSAELSHTVTIELTTHFDAFFPFFSRLPIRASATGAYLLG